MSDNTLKQEILKKLSLDKCKWLEIKGKKQDVTHENFIDNVILVYDWIMSDIAKMNEG